MRRFTMLKSASLALLMMLPLSAKAEPLDLRSAVIAALNQHPDLAISAIDQQIAQSELQRVEGMLDPQLSARIGASEETTPVTSSFQPTETRSGQLTGAIAKPLASGGTLGANFAYSRTSQAYQPSPLSAQLNAFNPAYRNQINLNYRHPLIKGSDRPDYVQSLTASEAGIQAAELQQQLTARSIAIRTVGSWYQLASDEINVDIAEEAVARAKDLLQYQRIRERFGLIEKADRLQAEALLAARKTDLQRARASRAASLSSLNRLLRRSPQYAIEIELEQSDVTAPDLEQAYDKAEEQRVELALIDARIDAAEAELAIASDKDQIQLDLVAEVGTRALDRSGGGAAAGGFSINDRYASLALELNETVGRNSARATLKKAALQRERLKAERLSALEQIRDDIATASTTLNNGIPTLDSARLQARAERAKFRAEMKRYREGRSDTATLIQFEGELTRAELTTRMQALSLQLAEKQLLWATGALFESLQIDLAAGE